MKSVLATTGVLLVALAADARAQLNIPFGAANYEHDLQIFAPLELDLDNLPEEDVNCGYFFEYNKLAWSYSGERITVGSPNVEAFAEVIYYENPDLAEPPLGAGDQGSPPAPYQVFNALRNVPPDAGFAFGNRYELGYRDRDNGWAVSILDGPQLSQTQVYGFGGRNPPVDPDYTNLAGTGVGPQAGGGSQSFGFGSVPVLFETPPDYLLGFRDYLNFLAGAITGTQVGPIWYVGNYGMIFEPDVDDDTIPFFRLTDDLDGDGNPGAGFTVDADGNVIVLFTDFDDLHEFNVFFDQVSIRNTTETRGVEVMWSHVLTNQKYLAKRQNNHLELFYGARFFRLYDDFEVIALGSILGDSFWDTSVANQIVGPQVALRWINQRQRWTISTDARFTFGYNVQDWNQVAAMGSELIPGATNRLLYGRPTYSAHGRQEEEFSPLAELRVEAAYHLTRALALKVGYTGTYVGNIRRASTVVHYELPDMGMIDTGTQNLVVNGVHCGVEFVH